MSSTEPLRHNHKHGFILLKDDIMECYLEQTDEVDLEQARYSSDERVKFCKGKSYPCLFDLTKVKNVSKEARDYLATKGNEFVAASALLINSPVSKMIGNFFIAVNKPVNPTRIFTSKDEALKWLEQYK